MLLFYIGSLTIIGCIVPYTDPRLGVKDNAADVKASPFVIAADLAKIPIIPHIMNAVILISVLSVGNASTYAASRTLEAMAELGHAPKFFTYIDKMGRPLATLGLVLLAGPIAYIGAFDGGEVFGWLFALISLGMFFTWYLPSQQHLIVGDLSFSRISASERPLTDKKTRETWPWKTYPSKPCSE
jgi:yeast amino acid transporter